MEKFNAMIASFSADFQLVKDGTCKLGELDALITIGNKKIINDIELLEELEYGLRHGLLEICEVEKKEK